ncbi:hypothetical protein D3C87_1333570 [compost metagenome]
MVKEPLASVMDETVVPLILMLAPGTGRPLSSTTLPLIISNIFPNKRGWARSSFLLTIMVLSKILYVNGWSFRQISMISFIVASFTSMETLRDFAISSLSYRNPYSLCFSMDFKISSIEASFFLSVIFWL